LQRVLVLSTKEQASSAEEIARLLGSACAGIFAGAVMHTPIGVTEAAMEVVGQKAVDGIVAVGGGSTIGLGKAIALRSDLPQIVIPTTYAGSEVTPIIGESDGGIKKTQTTPKVLPEVVIYDVDLTLGLPTSLSATSGINAIAHAVEALYARDGNPIVDMMAVEGVRALADSLPRIVSEMTDLGARADAQYGAWLCGTCLGSVGMSLHHKLCHTLGGSFDLPHAETHAIVLPHALRYNAPAVPRAIAALAGALGHPDPARALYDLAGALGVPRALRDLGMPESGIDRAADLALANPYWNPRPLERVALRACIAAAWAGEPPRDAAGKEA
jgi:alcohol dehydrogenase class IV